MGTRSIPIIDVGADGAADAIDRACREVGFFGIVGHGVPDAVVDHAWSAATRFFDLPLEDKLALAIERDDYPYGYSPLSSEVLGAEEGADAADLNESFSVSPPPRPEVGVAGGFDLTYRLWPSRPGDFAVAWAKYYEHMAALADRLLALCAAALHLESGYFVPYTDRHVSALRALNYPPQESPPVPGQIRAGAHTDYGTITILRPGAATGGLQVLDASDKWLAVPPIPDGFVVNLGDLMARWTNDRWRSTLHRVVNPDRTVAATERRQSMAFFHQPNWDAEISCLPTCESPDNPARYEPVVSGPWLRSRFEAAHAD